jgi:hypothetical protein
MHSPHNSSPDEQMVSSTHHTSWSGIIPYLFAFSFHTKSHMYLLEDILSCDYSLVSVDGHRCQKPSHHLLISETPHTASQCIIQDKTVETDSLNSTMKSENGNSSQFTILLLISTSFPHAETRQPPSPSPRSQLSSSRNMR